MMKTGKKKIFLVLLFMMLCLFGSVSHASAKTVCSIGKKGYSSFAAAVKAVKNGQTIKLKKDAYISDIYIDDESSVINRNVKCTIDMNGQYGAITVAKGTVTFKNGGKGARISVKSKGNVIIKSGEFTSLTLYGGQATVDGGTFREIYNGVWNNKKGGKLTVNKGKIEYLTNYASSTVNGGTFNYIKNYEGTLIIRKANITWECINSAVCILDGKKNKSSIKLLNNFNIMTVKSGIFNCEKISNHKTLTVKGGTLSKTAAEHEEIGGDMKITGGTVKGPIAVKTLRVTGGTITGTINNGKISISGGKVKNIIISKYYRDASVKITGGSVDYVECCEDIATINQKYVRKLNYIKR